MALVRISWVLAFIIVIIATDHVALDFLFKDQIK